MNSDELARLQSMGLLDADQAREFAKSCAASPEAAADLQEWQEVAASIALAAPAASPSPALKDRLLANIRKPRGLQQVAPGLQVAFARDAVWRNTPFPGVTYRPLSVDRSTRMATSILRMEPGSVYPGHKHEAPEQALILEGDCFQGSVYLQTGDYQLADGDTVHEPIRTDNGCLILVMASQNDELLF
jgi:anti-sigma factor ChrR (cupin superfamily)